MLSGSTVEFCVFISKNSFQGNLGNVSQINSLCNNEKSGSWALISTQNSSAIQTLTSKGYGNMYNTLGIFRY